MIPTTTEPVEQVIARHEKAARDADEQGHAIRAALHRLTARRLTDDLVAAQVGLALASRTPSQPDPDFSDPDPHLGVI